MPSSVGDSGSQWRGAILPPSRGHSDEYQTRLELLEDSGHASTIIPEFPERESGSCLLHQTISLSCIA